MPESKPSDPSGATPATSPAESSLFVAAGVLLLAIGAGLFHPGAGLITAGLACVTVGVLGAPRKR